MLERLIEVLTCPWCAGAVRIVAGRPRDGRLTDGELGCVTCGRVSIVKGGIWDALGPHRPARTAAQLSNVVAPTPQLYERIWRVRSLSLLSGRSFPVNEELQWLVEAADPRPGSVMIDVACSEGLYARALAARGATVIALDHSRPFLERAVARAAREGLAIVAVRGLAQHLPIRSRAVDAAVMGGSLNEIGDAPQAVTEMARVSTGSVVSMSLVTARTGRGRLVQRLVRPAGIVFWSEADTVSMFERAGVAMTDVRRDRVVLRIAGRSVVDATDPA